jgi:hypothetical protein
MIATSNPLLLVLVALGGYFGSATVYQLVAGGSLSRMFGGSTTEVVVQLLGALAAVLLVARLV